jgi:hypothetical protein
LIAEALVLPFPLGRALEIVVFLMLLNALRRRQGMAGINGHSAFSPVIAIHQRGQRKALSELRSAEVSEADQQARTPRPPLWSVQ